MKASYFSGLNIHAAPIPPQSTRRRMFQTIKKECGCSELYQDISYVIADVLGFTYPINLQIFIR